MTYLYLNKNNLIIDVTYHRGLFMYYIYSHSEVYEIIEIFYKIK